MLKSESFKRLKASDGSCNGIDRISNLPEPLISHILSLLPTKCVVATSVLSKRWKFSWTSITTLDIDNHMEVGILSKEALDMKRNDFTRFMNRVLFLLNSPSIQNFTLSLGEELFEPKYVHSWIDVAIGFTVGELDLWLDLDDPIEIPLNHIYCNVAVLKLRGDIDFNIHAAASICFPNLHTHHLNSISFVIASNSSVTFPNLKILSLTHVHYGNEDSVVKLFSSCPILDNLVIERDNWVNILCLTIHIPSLTSLSLKFLFGCVDEHEYKLQIHTPALQYLYLHDNLRCEYLHTENLSSLLQAQVQIDNIYGHVIERCGVSILKFIESLSKVKSLSVSGHILKAIRSVGANISTGFYNLTRLELENHDCVDLSVVINSLLERIENLEHLSIKARSCNCSGHSWWTEPLNVPKCLLPRVTTLCFKITSVYCCDQLELLSYFMKNAEVLQLLTIGIPYSLKKVEFIEKISKFPRGSQTCQLVFT